MASIQAVGKTTFDLQSLYSAIISVLAYYGKSCCVVLCLHIVLNKAGQSQYDTQ